MPADPKPEDWAILGVERGCTRAAARAAYRVRATALHPDRHPDVPADDRRRLVEAMAALNAAWERLEAWEGWDAPPPHQEPPPSHRAPPSSSGPAPAPAERALPEPPPGFVRARNARGLTVGDQIVLVGRSAELLSLARTRRGVPYTLLRCENRKLRHEHLAAAIDALPELRHLDLEATGIGDDSVALLARRPRLTEVRLGDTAITDAAMVTLANLRELSALQLAFTAVTDAGVARLRGHERLTVLNLRGTRVTSAGLDAVVACPSLRLLSLPDLSRDERRSLEARRADVAFL